MSRLVVKVTFVAGVIVVVSAMAAVIILRCSVGLQRELEAFAALTWLPAYAAKTNFLAVMKNAYIFAAKRIASVQLRRRPCEGRGPSLRRSIS